MNVRNCIIKSQDKIKFLLVKLRGIILSITDDILQGDVTMKKFLTAIASILVFVGVFSLVIEYLQGKQVNVADKPKVSAKRDYISLK